MLCDLKAAKILALVLWAVQAAGGQLAYRVTFRGQPVLLTKSAPGFDMPMKAVSTSWDETRVLNGVPPKYITIARRSGKDWFVGSITDWDARELDVPLTFLASGAYEAEMYSDGPKAATEPRDSVVEKRRVNAQTVLKLKLAPGGGSAIRLVPVRQ